MHPKYVAYGSSGVERYLRSTLSVSARASFGLKYYIALLAEVIKRISLNSSVLC
jgi:hypothetical protein